STPKLEEYRKELLPIMHQVQSLTKRSIRDYTHFLGFYPSSLPPFSTSDEGTSKASTPIASRDSSPVRSFKEKDDNLNPSINITDQQVDTKTTDKSRKPVEKEANLPSEVGTLNYVLIGDLHTGALWHARISEMHECIEGYPVFLPARSMAQADYMEVLERVKKANSLAQHEKLKELVEIVKQKEKEREEKEREWMEKHQHTKMLLASAEDDKDMIEGKKLSVKIGKKTKNTTHNKNGNSVTPVIGIDGQRHHPCCPLAPGNHSSSKENNYNHNHTSSIPPSATSNNSSSGGNSNGNSHSTAGANTGGNAGFKTDVEKIAQKCGTVPSSLPEILQDEETARIVYRAMKESLFPDDPALVIKWDDKGFNDVPTVPGCRNGIAGQTKAALITHLVTNGAVDVYGLNLVYMFRSQNAYSQCEDTIPA
ncbi:15788_t:CDS:2, partial [Racocetra persica]